MTASIILAAGESKRMGSPKLLLEYKGKMLLHHAVSRAQAVTDEVIVVVGAYPELYSPVAKAAGAQVVVNMAWQAGMGGSLKTGLTALPAGITKSLVVLADQPFVPTEHLEALLATCSAKTPLIFSHYDGVEGPPAALEKRLFAPAKQLEPHCGLKALKKAGIRVTNLTLDQWQDIDSPHDRKLLK